MKLFKIFLVFRRKLTVFPNFNFQNSISISKFKIQFQKKIQHLIDIGIFNFIISNLIEN